MTPLQKERLQLLTERFFDIWRKACAQDKKDYAKYTVELAYTSIAGDSNWYWNIGLNRYYNDYDEEFSGTDLDKVLQEFYEYLEERK